MEPVVVNMDILSVFADHLSLNPLSWSISNVNPLANGQFSPLKLERGHILDKVMVKALDELIDSMLILLESL